MKNVKNKTSGVGVLDERLFTKNVHFSTFFVRTRFQYTPPHVWVSKIERGAFSFCFFYVHPPHGPEDNAYQLKRKVVIAENRTHAWCYTWYVICWLEFRKGVL